MMVSNLNKNSVDGRWTRQFLVVELLLSEENMKVRGPRLPAVLRDLASFFNRDLSIIACARGGATVRYVSAGEPPCGGLVDARLCG